MSVCVNAKWQQPITADEWATVVKIYTEIIPLYKVYMFGDSQACDLVGKYRKAYQQTTVRARILDNIGNHVSKEKPVARTVDVSSSGT